MGHDRTPPPHQTDLDRATSVRPRRAAHPVFAEIALPLFEQGYEPIPVLPGTKKPAVTQWTSLPIDEARIEDWVRRFPDCSIGLRTGRLVAVDIDILDPDLSHEVFALVRDRLGQTLLRVGQWPKRLLLYRTTDPRPKQEVSGGASCSVEIHGLGQQVVGFGIHPDTLEPYRWPLGESPLDVSLEDLPVATAEASDALLAEIAAMLPEAPRPGARRTEGPVNNSSKPIWEAGKVVDGRDNWLSRLAFGAVHDALESGIPPDVADLASLVWDRFRQTADIARPRKDGHDLYSPTDARRKVGDKLRLHAEGRLPSREADPVDATYTAPTMTVEEARSMLDERLRDACNRVFGWHCGQEAMSIPRIGIKATVGLGKSTIARRRLLDLRAELVEAGKPGRIVVVTPSLALAEEAAAEWRATGLRVAVMRGYERKDPDGAPMCRKLDAVRVALSAGVRIHTAACDDGKGARCRLFATCMKQQNRRAVQDADIVLASNKALFSGFAIDPATVGVLVIDEGCWQEAVRDAGGIHVETFGAVGAGDHVRELDPDRSVGALADLAVWRRQASEALAANGPGVLVPDHILNAGLTADDCRAAAALEHRLCRAPGLRPGAATNADDHALRIAAENGRLRTNAALWSALAEMLDRGRSTGRVRIGQADRSTGLRAVTVLGIETIHPGLAGLPILHLDATLRPEIANTVLPGLEVTSVEAAAPHMAVRLVTGSFGKSTLVEDPHANAAENTRRRNRLEECVDYVRWQARRHPGGVLVATHMGCEQAFAGIDGVDTVHFNALAGLDTYKSVACLIVIGRPLPRDTDLASHCAAVLGRHVTGGYHSVRRGIRMRDGRGRAVRVMEHRGETAELLRKAICDDQLIQAIGRGRGINRTGDTPLEVHVLANVALPLVHDLLMRWEAVAPDMFQRMLLAGIAVDSPADAVALHPALFKNKKQAQKEMERRAFRRQNPIGVSYREGSPKSAAYKRPGKGHSWHNAYWLEGNAEAAKAALTRVLGPLDGWIPASE